jgi:hypothetical protein
MYVYACRVVVQALHRRILDSKRQIAGSICHTSVRRHHTADRRQQATDCGQQKAEISPKKAASTHQASGSGQ